MVGFYVVKALRLKLFRIRSMDSGSASVNESLNFIVHLIVHADIGCCLSGSSVLGFVTNTCSLHLSVAVSYVCLFA